MIIFIISQDFSFEDISQILNNSDIFHLVLKMFVKEFVWPEKLYWLAYSDCLCRCNK